MVGQVGRLLSCCVAATLLWACGPVYIPVPPPAAATETAFTVEVVTDASGTERQVWTAVGAPHAPASDATYYVFDQERSAGVIAVAAADGSYRAPPMEGTEGDRVIVRYVDAKGEDSAPACFFLGPEQPVARTWTCPGQP